MTAGIKASADGTYGTLQVAGGDVATFNAYGNFLVGAAPNPTGTGQIATTGGIVARTNTLTSTTSPWAWSSALYDQQSITALANALTISADSGSPVDGQKTIFRIKDTGTARTLTWTISGAKSFRAIGAILPTTTISTATVYIGCIYNGTDAFWDVVAVSQQQL
jgi:hypothetical protein